MTALLILAVLAVIWAVGKGYLSPSPKALAAKARPLAGMAALAVALLLALRGRFDVGLMLGGVGAWLLGHDSLKAAVDRWTGRPPRPRAVSTLRSATVSMHVDLESGDMQGEVLAGPLTGQTLDSLPRGEIVSLLNLCVSADPLGAGLLEAYLDRRFPGWRQDFEFNPDGRQARPPQPAVMTPQEAYQILGLQPGAAPEEIRSAYRSLMKKLHPDHGGPAYLAMRVNEARDVLLGKGG